MLVFVTLTKISCPPETVFVNGELTDESVLLSGYRIQIGKFNLIITKVDKKWILVIL